MLQLSTRQVHLDFHTSERIPDIGAAFDADAFAEAFAAAHVSSVTVFARCHHGWLYYPSKKFPKLVHPNLKRKNLLIEQVDALHARGIKAPVYITVQWDYQSAQRHPEWLVRKKDGAHEGGAFSDPGFYQSLCVNTEYYNFLEEMTTEVMDLLGNKLDGLFFDIVGVRPCVCASCRRAMIKRGLDVGNDRDVNFFAKETLDRFKKKLSDTVRKRRPGCSIFYNSGHVGAGTKSSADAYSHFELESLPSGGWGYLHFPVTARYARMLGRDCMGMTGKFHTAWGDFHSLKNQAALEFECFRMLSYGFACSIGDQLEPCGKINPATYDLIGRVYLQIEEREEWARPSHAVCEAALLTPESPNADGCTGITESIFGACQMLEELSLQFDILDCEMDFSNYKLLILPEGLQADEKLCARINTFAANGGKVIAVRDGGLCNGAYPECYGVSYAPHEDACNFVVANGILAKQMPTGAELVMYLPSATLTPGEGTEVLMETTEPYFYRKGQNFCSHRYTPSSKKQGGPAVTRSGNVIVFSHALFLEYRKSAPRWCKEMMRDAIDLLLGEDKLIRHDGASTLQMTLLEQEDKSRYALHVLSYVPVRKCTDFDVIEERTKAYDLTVELHLPHAVKSARLVPENIPVEVVDGKIRLDRVDGYQIVELNY